MDQMRIFSNGKTNSELGIIEVELKYLHNKVLQNYFMFASKLVSYDVTRCGRFAP